MLLVELICPFNNSIGLKSVLQTLWTKGKDHPNATEVTIDNVTGNYVQWWENAVSTCDFK